MKTILLPFHDREAGRNALATATLVARRFQSYLEGLLVLESPHVATLVPGISVPAEYLSEAVEEWRRYADATRTDFLAVTAEAGIAAGELDSTERGVAAGWRELEGRVSEIVGEHGRLFDLTVLGRTGSALSSLQREVLEAALFDSGRLVLLAPLAPPETIADQVVVAWNGTTEAARTVALGLPMLAKASKVTILTIEGAMLGTPPATQMAAHLARHGIPAEARIANPAGRSPGEAILAETKALGADLLLKGAYTRSRLRQIIFGGTTQHIIDNAEVPVLMAH